MKNYKAFTLVEVLLTVGIVIIVLVVAGLFFRDIFYLSSVQNQVIHSHYSMRQVLRQFVKEVRTAEPSVTGNYPISEATPTSFTFFSNVMGGETPEKVQYVLENDNLVKNVFVPSGSPLTYPPTPSTTTVVIKGAQEVLNESIFTYHSNGDIEVIPPLEDPVEISEVGYIQLKVVIDENLERAPEAVTIKTGVGIRNIQGDE